MELAYAIEFMAREKALSKQSMEKLLRTGRGLRQTSDQQRAVLQALSGSLGVPLQKMKRGPTGSWIAA